MTTDSPKSSARTFDVERRIAIDAEPARIHALINNFHEWEAWSPWEDVDPGMERSYSGPESGVGASYSWRGNKKAGSGTMTIRATDPPEKVVVDLHFLKPFEARNLVTFLIEPQQEGGNLVRWQMTGEKSMFMRIFGFIMNMDKLVGKDFEKGLARLKATAEAGPPST